MRFTSFGDGRTKRREKSIERKKFRDSKNSLRLEKVQGTLREFILGISGIFFLFYVRTGKIGNPR